MKSVCLTNRDQKKVRVIPVSEHAGELLVVKTAYGRISLREIHDLDLVEEMGWSVIDRVTLNQLKEKYPLGDFGFLSLDSKYKLQSDVETEEENRKTFWTSLILCLLLALSFLGGVYYGPKSDLAAEPDEEIKQQIVKIIKSKPKPPPRPRMKAPRSRITPKLITPQKTVQTKVTTTKRSLKRTGALAALGDLNSNSKHASGLNLGAKLKSAGPGLGGGTAGSGGVQTSIYSKGLTSAPLGEGGNLQGAGGYGTKGKGGGSSGYGQRQLKGSAGVSVLPLAKEISSSGGGLDLSQIMAVVRKNKGQITYCYEKALQSDPSLKGVVTAGWVIGANGRVKNLSIKKSTLASRLVQDCIKLRVKTWKFPLPEGGVDVKVAIPFNLRKQARG